MKFTENKPFNPDNLRLNLVERKGRCECDLCKNTRRFYKVISKLSPKTRKYLDCFYNCMLDTECELEMALAYNEDLKKEIEDLKKEIDGSKKIDSLEKLFRISARAESRLFKDLQRIVSKVHPKKYQSKS